MTLAHIEPYKRPDVTTDRDSAKDYPKIGGSICLDPVIEARRINMVGHSRVDSRNNSSKYPMIRGSMMSDAQTPSNRVVQNINPDFNAVQPQTILESIQCMTHQDSPVATLVQQGAEAVVQITVAELSITNQQGKPSIGNRSDDWGKRARSEEASSISGGKRLVDSDTCHQIT
jgi:hypothetical protein